MTAVDIVTALPPADYCPRNFREGWATGAALLSASLAGENNTFVQGETTPGPDDQDKPWVPQQFSGGNPPAFVWQFVDGYWLLPHPMAPGAVILFTGSEADITTFDGGEAGTVSATTGPMWEKLSSMDGRFPIGPGTLESTAVVAVGAQGGSEKVELIEENLPVNEIQGYNISEGANLAESRIIADDDRNNTALANPVHSFGGDEDGVTVPHSNMPPYTGIFFIKRTARRYYRR